MFIEIEGLCFRYPKAPKAVIDDFSLTIDQGEVICILGESGGGKSTVLRLVAGLEVPSKGRIRINDITMVDESVFVQPEKRGVGMVFQDYSLFPHMTVAENIRFGLNKMTNKEKDYRITQMLDLVSLGDYKKRYPYELSGGQQQRVAIARTLAPKPSLLLLDEPFSNLDAHLRSKIREEIKIILRQTNITVIFVTHDEEDAKSMADRVVILKEGKIVEVTDHKLV
ncbi:MAG TPA: ABC transporter [Desulfosporosinus sp.]|nr:ABC transporter [Desulfosporosinus sp.]